MGRVDPDKGNFSYVAPGLSRLGSPGELRPKKDEKEDSATNGRDDRSGVRKTTFCDGRIPENIFHEVCDCR
jgi:hypothetical protein